MKKLIIILVLILSFQACKKDRLKDDKSILIGTWNWVYTEHDYGWCDGDSESENITTGNFQLVITKNGIMKFYKNGEFVEKYGLKFKIFNDSSPLCPKVGWYQFAIDLNNIDENNFGGCINKDTIITTGFLNFSYTPKDPSCENYISYFIKQ